MAKSKKPVSKKKAVVKKPVAKKETNKENSKTKGGDYDQSWTSASSICSKKN